MVYSSPLMFVTIIHLVNGEAKVCATEMQLCTPEDKEGSHPHCCPPAECYKIVIDVQDRPKSERYQCYTKPLGAPKSVKISYGTPKEEDMRDL